MQNFSRLAHHLCELLLDVGQLDGGRDVVSYTVVHSAWASYLPTLSVTCAVRSAREIAPKIARPFAWPIVPLELPPESK